MSFGHTRVLSQTEDDGMDISPAPPPDDEMEMDFLDEMDAQVHVLYDVDTELRSDPSMMSVQSHARDNMDDADVELQDVDDNVVTGNASQNSGFGHSGSFSQQNILSNSVPLQQQSFNGFPTLSTSFSTSAPISSGISAFQQPPVDMKPDPQGLMDADIDIDVDIGPEMQTNPDPGSASTVVPDRFVAISTSTAPSGTPTPVAIAPPKNIIAQPEPNEVTFEIDYDDAEEESEVTKPSDASQKTTDQDAKPDNTDTKEEVHNLTVLSATDGSENEDKNTQEGVDQALKQGDKFAQEEDAPGNTSIESQEGLTSFSQQNQGPSDATQQENAESTETVLEKDANEPYSGHPIMVVYEDVEISLFPPRDGDNSETFFLEDESLLKGSISHLFGGFRKVLSEAISDSDELEIFVDKLDLSLGEDHPEVSLISLSDLLALYLQLHENDGVECPALYLYLTTKPRFKHRLSFLRSLASEGNGISSVLSIQAADDIESLDEGGDFSGEEGQNEEEGSEKEDQTTNLDQVNSEVHEGAVEQSTDAKPTLQNDHLADGYEHHSQHCPTGNDGEAASVHSDSAASGEDDYQQEEEVEEGEKEEEAGEETIEENDEGWEADDIPGQAGEHHTDSPDEGRDESTSESQHGVASRPALDPSLEAEAEAAEDFEEDFDQVVPLQPADHESSDSAGAEGQDKPEDSNVSSQNAATADDANEPSYRTENDSTVLVAGSFDGNSDADATTLSASAEGQESPRSDNDPSEHVIQLTEAEVVDDGYEGDEGYGDENEEYQEEEQDQDQQEEESDQYGGDEGDQYAEEHDNYADNYDSEYVDTNPENLGSENHEDDGPAVENEDENVPPENSDAGQEGHDGDAQEDDAESAEVQSDEEVDRTDAATKDAISQLATNSDVRNDPISATGESVTTPPPDDSLLEFDLDDTLKASDTPSRNSPTAKRTWTEHSADDSVEDEAVKRVRSK